MTAEVQHQPSKTTRLGVIIKKEGEWSLIVVVILGALTVAGLLGLAFWGDYHRLAGSSSTSFVSPKTGGKEAQ